jgi:hypothetical protein
MPLPEAQCPTVQSTLEVTLTLASPGPGSLGTLAFPRCWNDRVSSVCWPLTAISLNFITVSRVALVLFPRSHHCVSLRLWALLQPHDF